MTGSTATARTLTKSRRNTSQLREAGVQLALLFALLVSLGVLLTLIVQILIGAIPLLNERGLDFVSSGLSSFPENAGVWQGIIGSLQMGLIVLGFAVPVGVATAIYLEEYAPASRLTSLIDVSIRNLAGVPSIVYGLLGLAIFVRLFGGITGGRTALTAGLTLALLALPIVIITAAESIRAVPQSLRQGGYGLGATRWEVTSRLVLPQAIPGILTGTILALSRAIGETAPLLVIGAVTGFLANGGAGFFGSMTESGFTALPVIVFGWARQPEAAYTEALVPAAILMLLLFTLSMNAAAIWLRSRYEDGQ